MALRKDSIPWVADLESVYDELVPDERSDAKALLKANEYEYKHVFFNTQGRKNNDEKCLFQYKGWIVKRKFPGVEGDEIGRSWDSELGGLMAAASYVDPAHLFSRISMHKWIMWLLEDPEGNNERWLKSPDVSWSLKQTPEVLGIHQSASGGTSKGDSIPRTILKATMQTPEGKRFIALTMIADKERKMNCNGFL